MSAGALALTASGDHVTRTLGALLEPAVAPRTPAYHTRPDLRIPALSVTTLGKGVAPGLIFLAPYNAPGRRRRPAP